MPQSFGGAAYNLPPWILNLTIDDAVKLQLLYLTGGVAPGGTVPSSGGNTVATPRTYNASLQGGVNIGTGNTSIQAVQATPRKIDIINTGANGVWVSRGATAGAGVGYYLAQYGVLSVDEPTTDAFNAISPSGAQNVYFITRVAA